VGLHAVWVTAGPDAVLLAAFAELAAVDDIFALHRHNEEFSVHIEAHQPPHARPTPPKALDELTESSTCSV
jgi:hypothetical protein